MKALLLAIFVAVVAYAGHVRHETHPDQSIRREQPASGDRLDQASSHTQVQGVGVVTRILADDDDGSRHQRFIVRLRSGQTVLIAHNTDLAPRIADLDVGDTVEYSGEYEWNPEGGVVHWTHRDPSSQHVAGWLKHDGRVFQ